MDNKEIERLKERNEYLEAALHKSQEELKIKSRALAIETALEKVSARTITMRNSAELSETSAVLFRQLKELGINALRTGVGIFDDANDAMELWLTTVSDSNEVVLILDYFNLHIHPVFENIIPARQQNQPFVLTTLRGEEVSQYYQSMSTYLSHHQHQVYNENEFFYSFFFTQGALNVVTSQQLTEEECNIMIQFAHVFGLIYVRFLDLQKAEEQAQEAFRQTSLDRVRAGIASMRTTDDLNRIIPLIWKELITMGVPFFRCGVFIINEKDQIINAYLSTPEGQALAVLTLTFEGTDTTRKIVENWKLQKVYTEQWNKEQFQEWIKTMLQQDQIKEARTYQAGEAPIQQLNLQFIPFSQGMLYVGSRDPLDEMHIDLVRSLADTFSVAYARYEDFKQLEDAKNKIEATLFELKSTQSQLIQSEKMASLGELTAGIAHEIQNPLNFVNNFSEINSELIEEMKYEIDNGNLAEVKVIANNIDENEQKILFHGKRADSIVKGMLQHSRNNSGVKEPTDINALTDEYLRLAYHGLRAKDKSFNATMKTDYDITIASINIIPQDIGRVILNLITNAFYVVNEKKVLRQAQGDSYEPTVSVSTKNTGDKVLICVKDNGNGVPQKVLDKIFQPFFTTKPTGQGTGLGLSLSYDIVKAHGGELKVETKEGEGSEFSIQFPAI